jgi:hypothetical protein
MKFRGEHRDHGEVSAELVSLTMRDGTTTIVDADGHVRELSSDWIDIEIWAEPAQATETRTDG